MPQLYVDLAIPATVNKLFTYIVPPELHRGVKQGVRVIAPFGKRTVIGIVVDITTKSHLLNLKQILDILDVEPVLSDELFHLTKWMAEYYITPWAEVLRAVLVQGATNAGKRIVSLINVDVTDLLRQLSSAPKQAAIIKVLSSHGTMSTAQLKKKIGSTSLYTQLNELERRGHITIEEQIPKLKAKTKFENIIEINKEAVTRWQEWLANMETRTGAHQHALLRELVETYHELPAIKVTDLLKKSRTSLTTLRTLEKKQVIAITKREVVRAEEYDLSESSLGTQNIILNKHQQEALHSIREGLHHNVFHAFLLHGVTGSGKTQVYVEAIRETLTRGKTSIALVPEISLTPQIVRRFKFHFGEKVVTLHSKMSMGERYDAWRLTKEGKYSIVIGPRSAIFAPLNNIGLIVVDEEQEASYKQFDQTPRYHARDVAVMRARECNAVVILGSATPSLESYANALNGKYTLLEMPQRVNNSKLPRVEVIDMASERRKKLTAFRDERKAEFANDPVRAREMKRAFQFSMISDSLKEKIEDRLRKKEGIILLQNRRGFSPFIECPDCGYVEMCENCNISLTYHRIKHHLRCHYCGFIKHPPETCPKCKSIDIQYRGIGTQRVEEELKSVFPTATIIRMDLDTTTWKGAHNTILRKFSEGDVDILLGTQMVAKGLDFPRVTLVGVISAETQMLLPDFRSSERTFQLLTQVAGRSGRSNLAGEVIIQTYQPQHESLTHVLTHDFKGFYNEEIEYRKELHYPPFSRIIVVEFKGKNESDAMHHANNFAELLKQNHSHFIMLGPAPAVLTKLKGLFRWHIVLKDLKSEDPGGQQLHRVLKNVLHKYNNSSLGKSKSVRLVIDVDPVGMM